MPPTPANSSPSKAVNPSHGFPATPSKHPTPPHSDSLSFTSSQSPLITIKHEPVHPLPIPSLLVDFALDTSTGTILSKGESLDRLSLSHVVPVIKNSGFTIELIMAQFAIAIHPAWIQVYRSSLFDRAVMSIALQEPDLDSPTPRVKELQLVFTFQNDSTVSQFVSYPGFRCMQMSESLFSSYTSLFRAYEATGIQPTPSHIPRFTTTVPLTLARRKINRTSPESSIDTLLIKNEPIWSPTSYQPPFRKVPAPFPITVASWITTADASAPKTPEIKSESSWYSGTSLLVKQEKPIESAPWFLDSDDPVSPTSAHNMNSRFEESAVKIESEAGRVVTAKLKRLLELAVDDLMDAGISCHSVGGGMERGEKDAKGSVGVKGKEESKREDSSESRMYRMLVRKMVG
ncbi:hypothetical protein HDU98_009317 [Podochytrium sp. JEL0797]|nr:hypothetical protein HDU98_009317 [Podochytrium sp. JEL0797]